MNKGILIEIKKDYAIVMNDLGIMESIKVKNNMQVGKKIFYFEEDVVNINLNRSVHKLSLFKTFGTFAALFLLIFTFFQPFGYQKAYAVVSLDINPSIQIEVDNKRNIVKVEGVNADGKNIDFSSVKGLDINQGIKTIKTILVEKQYLDKDSEVLVAFSLLEDKEDEVYENTIEDVIKTTFNTENVAYLKCNKDAVEVAKTQGISLGRYQASLSTNEEVKAKIDNIPVKEITSLIKDKENCIYWKADDDTKVETSNGDTNISTEKPIDIPIVKPVDITPPENDKVEQPIKEIAPPVQKPNEDNENTEIISEPEKTPETKPEIIVPPVEIPKHEEEKDNNTDSNDSSIINDSDTSNEDNVNSDKKSTEGQSDTKKDLEENLNNVK